MNKKLFICLIVLFLPVTLCAESENVAVGDYSYIIDKEEFYAIVRGGATDLTSVRIPSSITYKNQTYRVVGVDEMAFWSRSQVTSVSLPSTLKWIGKSAFSGCNMTSLTIPNSVNTIYAGAFGSCKALTTLSLPSKAITIQHQAFAGCSSLKSVDIFAGSDLQGEVFKNCTSLTNIVIPQNTTLGTQNFWGCTGLTKVTIWSGNTGEWTFSGCTSLTTVSFGSTARTIDTGCFSECTSLTAFVVPDQIEKIDNSAFENCTNLTTLTLGKGLKTIGSGVNVRGSIVIGCTNLSKVIIPDIASWCNVDRPLYAGSEIFYYAKLYSDENTEIKNLIIPEGVTAIKPNVFFGCKSIESVSFANSVESIGETAFFGCKNLSTLKIGSGLKTVGSQAMGNNYITKLIIPDIASFCGLSLEDYTSLYGYDVDRRLYSDENTEIKDLVIPEGVTSVGSYLFHKFSNITSLSLPNSLKTIETYAFSYCTGLKTILARKGLQSVAYYSFFFYRDNNKVDFYITEPTPPIADTNSFSNMTGSNKTLHVPENSLDLYKEANGWKGFCSIIALQDGDPGYEAPKDAVTLTAKNYTREYGDDNPTFEYTVTNGTITSGTPTITCSATATSPVGTYDIVIAKGTVSNSNVELVNGTLTITKAPLTISAGNYTKVEGEDNPTFTPTFNGFKNNETEAILTKQPTVSTSATKTSVAGEYPVTVSDAEAQNYAITYQNGTLTVTASSTPSPNAEPYAVLSNDNTVLTFYYDDKKASRGGIDINNKYRLTSPYGTATTAIIDASFADYRPNSTSYWFMGCSSLTSITGMENLHTDNVADMSEMFRDCSKLTSLNVSGFKTDKVTSMYRMFLNCSSLTNLDVRGFNTSIVTNMSSMFYGCTNLTSLDVSGFNTSNVTNMDDMFCQLEALTSLDMSGFNTSNVTSMFCMFAGCKGLTSLDVSGFKTDNVTNMNSMFSDCSSLTSLNVSGFNTSNVTDMSSMFYGCTNLTSLDVSKFNTSNVTSMRAMFYKLYGLRSLDLSNFKTDKVEDMSFMFYWSSGIETIYVGNEWSTAAVKEGKSMFVDCRKLVGGQGTAYRNAYKDDYTYAHIDGGTANPGYLTDIKAKTEKVTLAAKNYSRVYGDPNPIFEYTVRSGTITSGTPTITCSATATSPVGTYDIVIAKGTVSNSNVELVNGTLTITKTPLKIMAKDYTIKQGEALPTFEATYEGFKNSETSAVLTKQPTITTSATSASEPGEYDIIVSGAEAQNYEISYVQGKLTIGTPNITPGDANGDGEVDAKDIVAITDYMMGKNHENFSIENADVNGDGVINIADIILIVNLILSNENRKFN